jgi:type I restriction enzyme S subunit
MTWTTTRVDRIATVNARIGWKALTASEYQPDGYVFLATPNIKSESIDFEDVNYISEYRYEESPELKLQPGDVLLAKDGNTLGITNIVPELPRPATVNGSIAVLRAFDVESRFLRYSLASSTTQDLIESIKGGMGVPHLFQWDIKRLPITLPPPKEQRRIADYLDRETAWVDELIVAKRRMVELLQERFWTWVDSEVSKHATLWLPLRRFITRITDGPFGSSLTSNDYSDAGARVVRLGNIGRWRFRDDDVAFIETDYFHSLLRHRVLPGDLLIAGLGDANNPVGRACVAPDLGDAIVKADCYCASVNPTRATADFLALYLSSPLGVRNVAIAARGTTRSRINLEIARDIAVPVVPLEVQHQITASATVENRRLIETTALLHAQVALLQERRQALITAAVTGKFRVPGVAA